MGFEIASRQLLEILKTFTFTQPEPSLDEFISYSVLPNWNKDYKQYFSANSDPDKYVYLTSSDAHYNEGAFLDKGAEIFVNRNLKDPSRTFKDQVRVEYSKEMTPIKIGNLDGFNQYYCYEGCRDVYYVEKDNYVWIFSFSCSDNCNTKEGLNASKYAKDRDLFINSVKFLD